MSGTNRKRYFIYDDTIIVKNKNNIWVRWQKEWNWVRGRSVNELYGTKSEIYGRVKSLHKLYRMKRKKENEIMISEIKGKIEKQIYIFLMWNEKEGGWCEK